MKILSKFRHAVSEGMGCRKYYESLSTEELQSRRTGLQKRHISPVIVWLTCIALLAFWAMIDPVLLLTLGIAVSGTLLTVYEDHRQRKMAIEKILTERSDH